MRLPDIEYPSGTHPNLLEWQDWVRIILNDGRYAMRTVSSVPTWSADEGEFVGYASGTSRGLYTYINGAWCLIGFDVNGVIKLGLITDTDGDTKVQVEESTDEDKIRFDTGGTERGLLSGTGTETYLRFNKHSDIDGDTFIQVEQATDEDKIRFDIAGGEVILIDSLIRSSLSIQLGTGLAIQDTDGDTKIQVEESADEDKIRFDTANVERLVIDTLIRPKVNLELGTGLAIQDSDGDTKIQVEESTDEDIIRLDAGNTQVASIDSDQFGVEAGIKLGLEGHNGDSYFIYIPPAQGYMGLVVNGVAVFTADVDQWAVQAGNKLGLEGCSGDTYFIYDTSHVNFIVDATTVASADTDQLAVESGIKLGWEGQDGDTYSRYNSGTDYLQFYVDGNLRLEM